MDYGFSSRIILPSPLSLSLSLFYDQFLTFLYIWTSNIIIHLTKKKFEFDFS